LKALLEIDLNVKPALVEYRQIQKTKTTYGHIAY